MAEQTNEVLPPNPGSAATVSKIDVPSIFAISPLTSPTNDESSPTKPKIRRMQSAYSMARKNLNIEYHKAREKHVRNISALDYAMDSCKSSNAPFYWPEFDVF